MVLSNDTPQPGDIWQYEVRYYDEIGEEHYITNYTILEYSGIEKYRAFCLDRQIYQEVLISSVSPGTWRKLA